MVLGVLRGRGELGRGPGNKGWVGGAGSVSLVYHYPGVHVRQHSFFYVKGVLGHG